MLYRCILRPTLFLLPAELAHRCGFAALRGLAAVPGLRLLLRLAYAPKTPTLHVRALGLDFPHPVGLAAGFDKDAKGIAALSALGFAFIEVGTLTAEAQPGNPKPRLFRLPDDAALINRLGFNNGGAAAAARRLRAKRRCIVGVNIGKTRAVDIDAAISDYVRSTELLAAHADYLVVNVSSPNTPGLRDLQAVDSLRPLLTAVRQAADRVTLPQRRVPLLVKIAPDLADADLDAVAALALELRLDGIIATNTTIRRDDLRSSPATVQACGAGGLSGRPLKRRSLAVLRRLRAIVGDRLTLIAVGGIETAADVTESLSAGATLVQLYTAFVYQGPGLIRQITAELKTAKQLAPPESTFGLS